MQFNRDNTNQLTQITSHEHGSIIIGEKNYATNVVLINGQILENLLPDSINEFSHVHLQQLIDYKPDLIILGTGKTLIFPAPGIQAYALSRKIGLEVMSTSAACRTYNVLLSESRNVLATLFQ